MNIEGTKLELGVNFTNVGTEGHCDHGKSTLNDARVVVSGAGSLSRAIALHLLATPPILYVGITCVAPTKYARSLIKRDNSNFIQQKRQGKRRVY